MPSGLIDTKDLSLEDIPGELMEWLGDMAISEQLPDYWELGSVDWVDGSDTELDVIFRWNKGYACEPYPEKEPVLAIETVAGDVELLFVADVGIFDDRTLDLIIHDSIHEMNQQRRPLIPTIWITQLINPVKIADLANKLFTARQTPFQGFYPNKFKYNGGKIYDGSDINYILMGHGMKHQRVARYLGEYLMRNWKFIKYGHLFLSDDTLYWFNKGYREYGGRADW